MAVASQAHRHDGAKPMNTLLSVDGVSKRFRGILAVDRLSFDIAQGGISAVIGPNGAGKTTVLRKVQQHTGGTWIAARDLVQAMRSQHPLAIEETFEVELSSGYTIDLGWDENDPNLVNIDFPMDIFVVKVVGEAFDGTNLDPTMQNPLNLPAAEVTMSLFTKNANLFSTVDIFRNIFGTAEFPTKTFPNMQFKQGDFARMTLKNNVKTTVAPFLTLIGYAPTPASIRRGDIQRGRVKPEQYDPQSVVGGRASR
jgi:energy-coupling factor transporter ATP-binding protein EcfA2